jgi:DNA-binding MarR family transcriptional regulator
MARKHSPEEVYMALVKFIMLSKRRVIEVGAEFGLTGMQAITLYLLDEPRPMNVLRKVFNCDASNITGLVDGLEHKGLAVRFENEQDRRVKCAKLAPKGEKMRKELIHKLTTEESPLLSSLNQKEYDTFIDLLQKITAGNPLGA